MKKALLIITLAIIYLSSCTSKEEKIAALYDQTNIALSNSDINQVLKNVTEILALDAQSAKAYFIRANCYVGMDKWKEAMNDYNKAVELKMMDPLLFANRGNLRKMMKDDNGACADWKQAEQLGATNLKEKTKFCQ